MSWLPFALLLLVPMVWGILTYNRFIRQRQMLMEAWSGIDVQLKRRHDLIPNLAESVKGISAHEREVLEEAVARRADGLQSENVQARGEAETALTRSIKGIFALAEAYPALQANRNFTDLQQTLTEIEDQIQYARRYYNGTVRDFNTLVQSFPSNLIASLCNFETKEYFELELLTEREAPDIAL
jgi:LemA protein